MLREISRFTLVFEIIFKRNPLNLTADAIRLASAFQ